MSIFLMALQLERFGIGYLIGMLLVLMTLFILNVLLGAIWSLVLIYNVYSYFQQKKELHDVGLK